MTIAEASGAIHVKVGKLTEGIKRQVISRGTRATNALRNAEQDTLYGQRHGKVRYKPGGGKYTASAPGEAPARRLGPLRNHWETAPTAVQDSGTSVTVTAKITSDTPYADYLESGTKKMARRPYVDKIKTAAMPKIAAIYSEPYV